MNHKARKPWTTVKKYSLKNYIRTNWNLDLKCKVYLFVGRIARFIIRSEHFYDTYSTFVEAQNRGRLSQNEILRMVKSEGQTVDPDYVSRVVHQILNDTNVQTRKTRHQQVAATCINLINKHPSAIKSVVNVGARIDFVSAYLAGKFREIKFTSVDFQPNLEDSNRFLSLHNNWAFESGYALELFETQKLRGDLIIFISTSVLFTTKELDAYFAALSQFANFVVINEPFWHPIESYNNFKVFRPENIDPHLSLRGGGLSNYLHNYPAILNANGFEVISSELSDRLEEKKVKGYRVEIVARNKNKV